MKLETTFDGETGNGHESEERIAELITLLQGWPVTVEELQRARRTGEFIRTTSALNYAGEIWIGGVPVLRAR